MAKHYITSILVLLVFVVGCGGGHSSLTLPDIVPAVHAQSAGFPQITQTSPTLVKWDLYQDDESHRFVLLGSAGSENCETTVCLGVPPNTWVEFVPPRLPFSNYCIDTLKLGAKEPPDNISSFLVLSGSAGRGQPSISVRSDDGVVKVDKLCYPHNGDAWPHLWIGNNWNQPQVLTFVVAGEVRP